MFENLGITIVLLRNLRGISQAKVAREAGIGKSQLSKYENGKELPKLDSLEKVLGALGIGYSEFFYTLQLVDTKAASLGETPVRPPVTTEGGTVVDAPTSEGFRRLIDDIFDLYGNVIRGVINAAQSASPGIDNSPLV